MAPAETSPVRSTPAPSTLHPTSSDGDSQTEKVSSGSPVEKGGKSANNFNEKHSPSSDSASSDSGYEDRGEHEVDDDDGKKKRVKVVLEKKTGKELVKEIGQGPYTIPRW